MQQPDTVPDCQVQAKSVINLANVSQTFRELYILSKSLQGEDFGGPLPTTLRTTGLYTDLLQLSKISGSHTWRNQGMN